MTTLGLMLHGVGSNGADLAGLVPYFQPVLSDHIFHSPDVPQPFGTVGNGFPWQAILTQPALHGFRGAGGAGRTD